jgi:hypothetical protein
MIELPIIYRDEILSDLEESIEDALNDQCRYYVSDLIRFLELDNFSFNEALALTEKSLRALHLPLKYNIKNIFRATETGIAEDLKLSPLAAYFISIHCDPDSPRVAYMQMYLAGKYNF